MSLKCFRKMRWVRQSPLKFFDKVFDAGLHDQRTLLKKTLTKFFMENLYCVKNISNIHSYGRLLAKLEIPNQNSFHITEGSVFSRHYTFTVHLKLCIWYVCILVYNAYFLCIPTI